MTKVYQACFVHSRGRVTGNPSAKIPELNPLSCVISRTVPPNALVDHGGFPLQAMIHCSRSSLCTLAEHHIGSWPSSTSIWIDSHPIAYFFSFLLHLVLRTVFKCVAWVIFSVATIAASRWTNHCLCCCCVSPVGALVVVPVVRLDSAPIAPGWSVSVAMTCSCGKVRKMITKEVGSPEDYIVSYKLKWNEWQPTCIFNSSWILVHIAPLRRDAGDSKGPAMCSMSVRCCLFVPGIHRDELQLISHVRYI